MKLDLRGGDLPLALLLMTISGAALWGARDLAVGTFTRMGPGFVPMALAGILMVLAVAILLSGLMTPGQPVRYALAPLLIILGSLAFVAVALERLGLIICIVCLVVLSSLAQKQPAWRAIALLSVFLAVFCYVLFVRALGLPIPAFPG